MAHYLLGLANITETDGASYPLGWPWLGLSPNYSKLYNFVNSYTSIGCSHGVVQWMCCISVIT